MYCYFRNTFHCKNTYENKEKKCSNGKSKKVYIGPEKQAWVKVAENYFVFILLNSLLVESKCIIMLSL